MTLATVRKPRMRVRSRWFKSEQPKSIAEIAGAMAFILWRVAHQALRNMRAADFEIDAGPKYFEFLSEWLVFLTQVADRIAFERLPDQRVEFTTVVANRLAETFADNRRELLEASADSDQKSAFIDLFNLRLEDYADFDRDDYGRLRYLAQKLAHVVGPHDALWVHEQVMEIEAPQAVEIVHGSLRSLLGDAPPPSRRQSTMSGE